jgi:hypothetical protein
VSVSIASNIAEEKARPVEGGVMPGREEREKEDVFAIMMDRSFLTTKE